MVCRWLVVIAAATACDVGAKPDPSPPAASSAARDRSPTPPPLVPRKIEWRDPCSLSIVVSDRYNIIDVDNHCQSGMYSGSFVRADPLMTWLEDQLKYVKTWHGGGCTRVEIATDNVSQTDLDRLRTIAVKVGFVDARFVAQRDLGLKFPDSEDPQSCEPRPLETLFHHR